MIERLKWLANPRVAVALFFALLTLVGLLTAGDYGLYCDEPAEQVILRENLKEYAARLLGAGSEAVRYYDALGIQRISESIERDHGECAYYLFAPALAWLQAQPDALSALWHACTWLWFMLGAYALYALCRELGVGRVIGCLAALIYVTCPRFFAEGHYNNKDMVLLSLALLTLWQGARFLQKPGYARGLWLSLFGAMAANTKIAGALPWALIGLAAVALVTARREWSARMARVAGATVAGFVGFYALPTPALWADPVGYFPYLLQNMTGFTRWTGVVIFKGARYEPAIAPLPHSYLPWLMLVTLPLYVPPLCAVGQCAAVRRALGKSSRAGALQSPLTWTLMALTLCWLIPAAFVVWRQPLMYNGWRHFYFVFAGLAPMLALGLNAIWRFVAKRGKALRVVALAALAALLALNSAGLVKNHPYQYGYYNALARASAETDMELDYWDVSTVNAMRMLAACERDASLPLLLGARDDMSWFGVEHGHAVLSPAERAAIAIAYEPDAPYLFVNTTYALIYQTGEIEGYHPLFTVESYGNTLCAVYERDPAP